MVAVLFVLTLLLLLYEVGARGFAVGLVLAVVPAPFYVLLALWLDRYEPEPRSLLAVTFMWGASIAVFVSFLANTAFETALAAVIGDAAETVGTIVSAPIIEELAKGIVLVLLFLTERDEFDNVTDGIVYAAMAGLGFATVENVLYYGNAVSKGIDEGVTTFVLRGIASPFAHPLFTAMTGIGLGVARETFHAPTRVLAPVLGLMGAMFLHFLWNVSSSVGDAFFAAYLLVMLPTFVGVLLVVRSSLRREAQIIRSHLVSLVDAGALTPVEIDVLCSTRGRLVASLHAARAGGLAGWRRRAAFHHACTELAFQRWRLARGIVTADGEGEAVWVERVVKLK
jgi:protease PrsW